MTDIAGLCERLRVVESSGHGGVTTNWHRNPDGPKAADTLERQAAEIERLRGEMDMATPNGWMLVRRNPHTFEPPYGKDQAAEIERLRGALGFYADPENWHGTYSVGHAPMNDDWDDDLQHPLYPDGKPGKRARAALTGEDA